MKNVLLCLVMLLCITSCMSPESNAAADRVAKMRIEMQADGVVTPEEQAAYNQAVMDWAGIMKQDAEKFDWNQFLATVGASVSTAFLGINVFRNSREKRKWGTPEDPIPSP